MKIATYVKQVYFSILVLLLPKKTVRGQCMKMLTLCNEIHEATDRRFPTILNGRLHTIATMHQVFWPGWATDIAARVICIKTIGDAIEMWCLENNVSKQELRTTLSMSKEVYDRWVNQSFSPVGKYKKVIP